MRYSGTRLGEVLAAQGRNQLWVAKQVGVSPALLSRIISGERTADAELAQRISGLLHVPLFLAFESPIGDESSRIQEVAS